jgi:Tol biopolymer transport system component
MQKRWLFWVSVFGGVLLFLSLFMLTLRPVKAELLNMKLSDPLQAHTYFKELQISPNGQYVLFTADIITENAFELYSVPMDGSEAPTLLSGGLLPYGAEVQVFHITPDSSRVLYVADQDTAGMMELYSVSITGGPITKLNPPITASDGEVEGSLVSFTPDSSRVVFMAEWEINNAYELFSVPVAGGTPVRLNGDLPLNGSLSSFVVTPDGSQVVYVASQDSAAATEVYVVPITGGNSVKLNDPLVAGGFVWYAQISADGSHVVYTAVQDVATQWEIFSVALSDPPGAPVKLNPPLGANRDVVYNNFRISPNGDRVVYLADPILNDVYLFYSVPIEGGAAVQLTGVVSGAPELGGQHTFEISPDNSRLVFRSMLGGNRQLFSVPLTGGSVTQINGPIIPDNGHVWAFEISPDSSRVVYQATQQDANSEELYSVPIGGGAADKLNSALPWLGKVVDFAISDNSQRVVYFADQQVLNVYELFSVPLADGVVTKLNPELVDGGGLHLHFEISPNSNHVVYVAEQEIVDVPELFVTYEESPPPPTGSFKVFVPFVQK